MRVAAIASSEGWHLGDLRRAAGSLGIELDRVDFRDLDGAAGGAPAPLPFDRALVRSMPAGTLEQVILRMDILSRLEASGARIVNPPRALECAIDKFLSGARLAEAGLPVPETRAAERAGIALRAFEELGGDVVVKPLFGSEGRGLERICSTAGAVAEFERREAAGHVLCLQRFIHHPGFDYRVFVLGDRILCGMRRIAASGWITNIARGGRAESLAVGGALGDIAVRAARAVGAEVAGVDILPDGDGRLWVLEVNAVPGWKALVRTAGVDVAREVLLYLVSGAAPARRAAETAAGA